LAYLHAFYRVWNPPLEIRIGPVSPALDVWLKEQGAETFAFITAWNPYSKPMPEAANRLRNTLLEMRLRETARLVLAGAGVSPTGEWPPEESFFAVDLGPETAVHLATVFEQNAILYWKRGGDVELWWVAVPLTA
jgi:hypothetical protein